MRRFSKVAIAVMVVSAVSASATAAKCIPIEPKTVEGHIEMIPVARQSMTAGYFEQNECDWGGAEQLNGLDAIVLDVEGMTGPAEITAIVHGLSLTPLETIFLHSNCARIGNPVVFGPSVENAPEAYEIEIPENTKWVMVQGSTEPPAGSASQDIDVKIQSEGKECPKKKKKKKGRS